MPLIHESNFDVQFDRTVHQSRAFELYESNFDFVCQNFVAINSLLEGHNLRHLIMCGVPSLAFILI